VNADFVQIFSDSRKTFISKPESLSLEAVFEMPKQETRKNQRELNAVSSVDMVSFARNCHRKTLLSLLLDMALPCIVCLHDQPPVTSLHSAPSNDLGENISNLEAAKDISPFGMAWHDINNLESMGIPDER
jgi:hypothetical protein